MFDDPTLLNGRDETDDISADLAEIHRRLLRDGVTWRQRQPDIAHLARFVGSRVPRRAGALTSPPQKNNRGHFPMHADTLDAVPHPRGRTSKILAGAMATFVVIFAIVVVNLATHHQAVGSSGGGQATPTPVASSNITPVPGAKTPIVSVATMHGCVGIFDSPTCNANNVTSHFLPLETDSVLITLNTPMKDSDVIGVRWFLNGTDIASNSQVARNPITVGNSKNATELVSMTTFYVPGDGKVEISYNGVLAFTAVFTVTRNPVPTPTPVMSAP